MIISRMSAENQNTNFRASISPETKKQFMSVVNNSSSKDNLKIQKKLQKIFKNFSTNRNEDFTFYLNCQKHKTGWDDELLVSSRSMGEKFKDRNKYYLSNFICKPYIENKQGDRLNIDIRKGLFGYPCAVVSYNDEWAKRGVIEEAISRLAKKGKNYMMKMEKQLDKFVKKDMHNEPTNTI